MEAKQTKIFQSIFSVAEKVFLTPNYIRVIFDMTEKQVNDFQNVVIGGNNKIFIPMKGLLQNEMNKETPWDLAKFAAKRTYTTRNIDLENKKLWIDFAAHGDKGPASAWALQARKGDVLGIAMKESNRPLVPQRNTYLLAGDMTAVPVIGAILEQLPSGVRVKVVLEVYDDKEEINLFSHADIDLKWLHNKDLDKKSMLADFIKKSSFSLSDTFLFVAAEYEVVKELREWCKEEYDGMKGNCSLVSYWKRGQSEDEFGSERVAERNIVR